jgi:hypothetical protein
MVRGEISPMTLLVSDRFVSENIRRMNLPEAIIACWTFSKCPCPFKTRSNRGGDHVPYCTPPDAVEPAHRRVTSPAAGLAPIAFNQ